MNAIVSTYTSNGPYEMPTKGQFRVSSLKELILNVRASMEDNSYQIGVFDADGQCKGIWVDESEPFSDGEGGYLMSPPAYVLYRPGDMSAGMWNLHLRHFKQH